MLQATFQAVQAQLTPALVERLTLLLNHVLSSEDEAMQRLRAHHGKQIVFQLIDTPAWLPAAPRLSWQITPAGLLEATSEEAAVVDLRVVLRAPPPQEVLSALLTRQAPRAELEGDASLASELNWLVQNLRWDIAADLERVLGAAPAHQVAQWGRAVAEAVAKWVQKLPEAAQWLSRARSGRSSP